MGKILNAQKNSYPKGSRLSLYIINYTVRPSLNRRAFSINSNTNGEYGFCAEIRSNRSVADERGIRIFIGTLYPVERDIPRLN
ncbi:MAG TPA: hypothetical protein VF700_00350 [Segetibacter sp.]